MAGVRRRQVRARFDAMHTQPVPLFALVSEAAHVYLVRSPVHRKEFLYEILDMNARAPVNVRGVLVGEDGNAHGVVGLG